MTNIALITGGSRGLGRDMARRIAEGGADVILTYQQRRAEAEAVVAEVTASGQRAAALRLDVADAGTFGAFAAEVERVLQEWGQDRFHFLVNNAGVGLHAPVTATTEAQFDLLMNVHLKGPFFLTQHLLPLIADGGRIVNVSTGLTRFTMAGYGVYASMKGAMEVMTRYLALELGGRQITVNTVAPGAIATDFGGGVVRDNPQVNAHIAAATALGRVGQPQDIGGVVAALLRPEMGWVNAQRIEVSGGQNL